MDSIAKNYREYLSKLQTAREVVTVLTRLKYETAHWFMKKGLSDRAIANQIRVSNTTIGNWRKQFKQEEKGTK
jgi:Trp operon repressor